MAERCGRLGAVFASASAGHGPDRASVPSMFVRGAVRSRSTPTADLRLPGKYRGMTPPPTHRRFEESFPSRLDSYQTFIDDVIQALAEFGWAQSDQFAVHMALEESISNGIRHGNKEDPAKRVAVECRVGKQDFWARICDEGPGFRPDDVPDCCSDECLDLPGGRGLALMFAYMTRVEYNERGNCVTLEKRLPGPVGSQTTAADR